MAKILIVDDCAVMRTVLRRMLEDGGHEIVGEARNGEEALDKYGECSPDLVTMDIQMVGVNGMESLQDILSSDSEAKVVMVTAVLHDPMRKEALEHGAAGYISKPFRMDLLNERIDMALKH